MKPRKNPLIRYEKTDKRKISFPSGSIEAETGGTIDKYGFLYIGKEFSGRKARGFVERNNTLQNDLQIEED